MAVLIQSEILTAIFVKTEVFANLIKEMLIKKISDISGRAMIALN